MTQVRLVGVFLILLVFTISYQNCDPGFQSFKLDQAQNSDPAGDPKDDPGTPPPPPPPPPKVFKTFLFLAFNNTGVIETYSIDATGKLTKGTSLDLNGQIVPMNMDPTHSFLYAGLSDRRSVAAIQINKQTGALTLKSTTPVGLSPVYLAIHPQGGSIVIPSYGDNEVAVYGIGPTGDLLATEKDRQPTGLNPHSAMFDRSGNFAFVPNCTSDYVAQYAFNATTGKLTPNVNAPQVATANNANPRHMAYHPKKEIIYVVNERDDTVTVYQFNATMGTLTSLQTVTTLPANFNGNNNTTADIHITSDGKFLYASNRGHNSLAIYTVDAVTGLLTPAGHQLVEGVPREFDIDPTGKFIFVGGQNANRLNSFAISPTTGMLTLIEAFGTSGNPIWLTTVEYPVP